MSNYNMKVSLSSKVRLRVECLRHLQSQHDELEAKFLEEREELEAKYQKLYQPLYTKRYEIVNGMKDVEGASNKLATIQEDPVIEEKGVPEFWLTAMKTHEVLAEEIKERDEGALKFINDIKWSRLHDPKGFKLEFYFNPNPYFKNSVLTKSYHVDDESDLVLNQAIGTEIEWFPGKCLTKKVVKKKPGILRSKNTKPIATIKDCESFFTFFNPPQIPENEDDLDDDAYDELRDRIEQDYSVGTIIRDKIIPHAVTWFTGEAIEDDELDGIDDDDIGDDDEEDEAADDDEESEDEDDDEDNSNKEDKEEDERKRGMKKDEDEDDEKDEEEEKEEKPGWKRNWGSKKKEDEEEDERKRGVKKDVDEDDDEDEKEGEEEKLGRMKSSDGHKKVGGAQIQKGQQGEVPPDCKQQ